MSKKCNLCNTSKCPKYDILSELEKDKKRILSGTEKTKKYYRRIFKYLFITCIILVFELILTLAYGKDGIMLGLDFILKLAGRNG